MKNYKSGSACEVFIDAKEKKVIKKVHYTNEGIENGHHKLIHEINYLEQMNNDCDFFPKILSKYYKNNYLYAEIEYLFEGESFADLIFDDSVGMDYLNNSLELIMEELFHKFYIKRSSEINPYYWNDCYIERTIRRLNVSIDVINNSCLNMNELKNCIINGITINGIHYESAYKYMDYLKEHNGYLKKIQPHCTYRSHHDLISDNILIQRGNNLISDFKMIDPRGESETGIENRHFIYDMGKMLFGLDCYRLFRQAYHAKEFEDFKFNCISKGNYELVYNRESSIIKRLIHLQKSFFYFYCKCYEKANNQDENMELQLMFSAACMYIPDIPCRIIDEGMEDLCIAFYARGMMFLHELMLKIYGKDELSSDIDGSMYKRWPIK